MHSGAFVLGRDRTHRVKNGRLLAVDAGVELGVKTAVVLGRSRTCVKFDIAVVGYANTSPDYVVHQANHTMVAEIVYITWLFVQGSLDHKGLILEICMPQPFPLFPP